MLPSDIVQQRFDVVAANNQQCDYNRNYNAAGRFKTKLNRGFHWVVLQLENIKSLAENVSHKVTLWGACQLPLMVCARYFIHRWINHDD